MPDKVIFDGTLTSKKHSHAKRFRPVLIQPNRDKPSQDTNGFFARGPSDNLSMEGFLNDLASKVQTSAFQAEYPDLSALELGAIDKRTNATGWRPYSYFKSSGHNPLHVPDSKRVLSDSVCEVMSSWMKGHAEKYTPSFTKASPDHYNQSNIPLLYRLHSNYGVWPFIAGRDKRTYAALTNQYYMSIILSSVLEDTFKNSGSLNDAKSINAFGEHYYKSRQMRTDVVSSFLERIADLMRVSPFNDMFSAMLLKRIKLERVTKARPLWTPVFNRSGVCVGLNSSASTADPSTSSLRKITAMPAFVNLMINPVAQAFTQFAQGVEGLHVGHQVLNTQLLMHCQDVWGLTGTTVIAEDISGYDDSVSSQLLAQFSWMSSRAYGGSMRSAGYYALAHTTPLITAGYDADGPVSDAYQLLSRDGGIPSGSNDTTMIGTTLNMCSCIQAMVDHVRKYKGDAKLALEAMANYRKWRGQSLSGADWGLIVKGDDLVLFFRKGLITFDEIAETRSSLGFTVTTEPGTIFLQNWISLRERVPTNMLNGPSMTSFGSVTMRTSGLISRRTINRGLAAENPASEEVTGLFAAYSNIIDTQMHPLSQDYMRFMMRLVSDRTNIKTFDQLEKYVLGQGRIDLQKYSEELNTGKADSYLNEMIQRLTAAGVIKSGQVIASDDTNYRPYSDPTKFIQPLVAFSNDTGLKAASEDSSEQLDGRAMIVISRNSSKAERLRSVASHGSAVIKELIT